MKLLVKGTNRHCFDPETGRAVSHERNLQDVRLIKQMNMKDHEERPLAVKEYPHGDISFLLEIPYVKSQGGGNSSYIKINKGDEGFRTKLWFE